MNVTATTRLTAAQCMERLAACPALPRGERGATIKEGSFRKQWAKMLFDMFPRAVDSEAEGRALWRSTASCVRRLRDERRALREALAEVLGGECEKVGRWCLTHHTNNCYVQTARMLLMTPAVVRLRAENDALKEAMETLLTGPARELLKPEEDLERSCDNCGAEPGVSCNCHMGRFIP